MKLKYAIFKADINVHLKQEAFNEAAPEHVKVMQC